MKKILHTIIALLITHSVIGQSTSPQTVSGGGNVLTSNGYSLSYTIGQTTSSTLISNGVSMNQGFQQPNGKLQTSAPVITSFSPTYATTGMVVTIKGKNFNGGTATTVFFGGVADSLINVVNDSTINATVSSTSASGSIKVVAAGGTATKTGFTFYVPSPVSLWVKDTTICPVSANAFPATIDIPIKVKDFINIVGLQGTMWWDTSIIKYSSIPFIANVVGADISKFTFFDDGKLIFSWLEPNISGSTLADSSILFTIRFTTSNKFGLNTSLKFLNSPLYYEATQYPTVKLAVNTTNGTISFPTATSISPSGSLLTCSNVAVTLGTSTLGNYQWYYNSNIINGATASTYSANSAGNYEVRVTANGCTIASPTTIIVNYAKPNPAFSINSSGQCINGNSFTFTNSSIISSGTMTYSWNYGDGGSAITANGSNVYASTGSYNVKLVTTSNNGCKDSAIQIVTIYPKPIPSFSINNAAQCLNTNSFYFTNQSTISSGTLTYFWNFGDGNTSTQSDGSNVYLNAGIYSIKLVVTSNNGCKDSLIRNITVYPKPIPSFTINSANQCINGNSYFFTNSSTISSGTLTSIWSYGDNFGTTLTNGIKVYLTDGTYIVKLVTTSNNGCKDSISKNVTVYPKPSPSFSINQVSQCLLGNNFVFTSSSSISSGTLNYNWNYGDGSTTTSTNSNNTYTTAGTFSVKLVVNSNFGCKDSIIKSITVNSQPVVSPIIGASALCIGATTLYTENTNGGVWSSGSISTATINSSGVILSGNVGSTIIYYTVTDANSCVTVVNKSITINSLPSMPIASTTTTSVYITDDINLFASSFVGVNYSWIGPNGFTSNLQNPSLSNVSSAANGYYKVYVTNATTGCNSPYDSVLVTVNNAYSVKGRLITPSGIGLSKGLVNITGFISNTNYPDASGNYYAYLPPGGNYVITPDKSGDITKANGVSSIDVALTQSYILQKTTFNSPYKIIAADVNSDKKVSTLDLVYMKRLILGIDTIFPNNKLWAFADSSFVFANASNPFPFNTNITLDNLSGKKTNQTFIGMKLGDVNWDWNPAIAKPYNNLVNAVELSYEPVNAEKDNLVRVPIKVKNFKEMMGLQFTLGFNADALSFKGIEHNLLNIETGTNHITEGKLSMLWLDPKNEVRTFDDNTQLMVLVFERKRSIINSQLSIDGSITTIEAFDKDYQLHGIVMKPSLISSIELTKESFVIAPNPTTNGVIHIQMNLKNNKTIILRLLDNTGRVLLSKQVEGEKGANNFTLNQQHHLTEGIYYLQAIGIEGEEVKKVIVK